MAAEIDPNSSPSRYHPSGDAGPVVPDHGLWPVWSHPGRIPVGNTHHIAAGRRGRQLLWLDESAARCLVRLPTRLVCQVQSGLSLPPPVTVSSVGVTHPRGNVLHLMVRFAQPPPPPPSYALTYSLANNGTPFAVLNPQQSTDDLIIQKAQKANAADIQTDKETHACRAAPDAVEISLDLTKFGIDKGLVNPRLAV